MIDPSQVHGKRMAMIIWGKHADGSDDVVVFAVVAHWDGASLTLRRDQDSPSFPVHDEWLSRIKPVSADLKEPLLHAEYCFSLSIGSLNENESLQGLIKTGLKWPKPDEVEEG